MSRAWSSVLVLALMAGAVPHTGAQEPRPARVVHIVAERFTFTPQEVVVQEGEKVELRLSSEDTTHGFRLIGPGDTNVEIPRRGRGEASVLLPDLMPGNYVFECSRVCGAGHGFMRGTVRVRAQAAR